jgi:hypothetical protein
MEKELRHLRKAMNSSTHKGVHFTELQKERVKAALMEEKNTVKRKSALSIYVTATLAASLFLLLFYNDFVTFNVTNNATTEKESQILANEWEIRNEYSQHGKVMFTVFPDPALSAGKPYGYLFSFKESFAAYNGKNLEIYATHQETGERIKVLSSEKITEPTPGYRSLERYTTSLTVPKSGRWKYEIYFDGALYGDVVLAVMENTFLPIDVPKFVHEEDFRKIDWNRKAVLIDHNILGNKNKSGVIGADMPSVNNGQKWLWHLWGAEPYSSLTVVGYHKNTETVHRILTTGWSLTLGGAVNGAAATSPSSVSIPLEGEWAMLLYVNGELFDILVYEIHS